MQTNNILLFFDPIQLLVLQKNIFLQFYSRVLTFDFVFIIIKLLRYSNIIAFIPSSNLSLSCITSRKIDSFEPMHFNYTYKWLRRRQFQIVFNGDFEAETKLLAFMNKRRTEVFESSYKANFFHVVINVLHQSFFYVN